VTTADLIPPDEAERLAAVRRYRILDTPEDGTFDRIAALAARVFDVPIAIVSIVDEERIWFKAHHGLEVQEIGRDPGLCASAILQDDPWIVADARHDPRTLANPLVAGEFGLQFYAGMPLTTTDGHNLGTICVIDSEPREVSDGEKDTLRDLARIVIDELELRLAALREEERLSQARSDFVTVASHELRTPVTAVHGAARSLRRTDLSDAQRDTLLGVIDSESERLAHLVDDILLADSLDRGRPALQPERVDAEELVRSVVTSRLAHLIEPREIEVNTPPHGTLSIETDRHKLRQVLDNLLDNAIKYSPTTEPVQMAVTDTATGVRFEVSDRGIGVPPDDAEHIFEKFHRLDPEQTQSAGGTGLGLFIAKRLTHELGGNIGLAPNRARGTTFFVELPAS
jgi:signal transduction histidine kinase